MMRRRLSKRRIRLLISALIGLTFIVLGGYYEAKNPAEIIETPPGTYRVVQVEDGDTITVDMNGRHERVRFIGIDTPETRDPRKPVQCFGRAASEFTKNLIGDNPVRLEADPLSGNRDRYDRLLRYVYLPDGRLVNAEIIKSGYGFAYVSFPFTKSEEFLSYQTQAREQDRGLWSECEPEQNQSGGYTSNPE